MVLLGRVKELFKYDPNTGIITNRVYRGSRAVKGAIAGTIDTKGYLKIKFDGWTQSAHRIAFFYYYGYLPDQIDHINGNKNDNKIANLRSCTDAENQHNRKTTKTNTSGYKGVSFCGKMKMWKSYVTNNKKRYHLGYFTYKQNAALASKIKRVELHKEFACHG